MAPETDYCSQFCQFRRRRLIVLVTSLLFLFGLFATEVVEANQHGTKSHKAEKHKTITGDLNAHREDLIDDTSKPPLSSDDNEPPLPVATFKNALMIVGPSASGKTTLANRLVADLGDQIHMLARHTSRGLRPKEVNGTDYIFVTRQEILRRLKLGEFLTISELADNIYGISQDALYECIRATTREGKLCMTEMVRNFTPFHASSKTTVSLIVFVRTDGKRHGAGCYAHGTRTKRCVHFHSDAEHHCDGTTIAGSKYGNRRRNSFTCASSKSRHDVLRE